MVINGITKGVQFFAAVGVITNSILKRGVHRW